MKPTLAIKMPLIYVLSTCLTLALVAQRAGNQSTGASRADPLAFRRSQMERSSR